MGQHVVIAEPDDILRLGLRTIFDEDPRVSDIDDVINYEDLHTQLDSSLVDLAVINQVLVTDLAVLPQGKFVIVTTHPDMQFLQEAYQQGGRGYLSARVSAELLRTTLRPTEGAFLLDPTFTSWLMPYLTGTTQVTLEDKLLTERQREVARLVREGMSRHAIAEQLSIADSTVKTHLKNIAQKRSQAQQDNEITPN